MIPFITQKFYVFFSRIPHVNARKSPFLGILCNNCIQNLILEILPTKRVYNIENQLKTFWYMADLVKLIWFLLPRQQMISATPWIFYFFQKKSYILLSNSLEHQKKLCPKDSIFWPPYSPLLFLGLGDKKNIIV